VKLSGWLDLFLLDHIPCASNFASHLLVLGPYDLLERDQPVQVSKISREKRTKSCYAKHLQNHNPMMVIQIHHLIHCKLVAIKVGSFQFWYQLNIPILVRFQLKVIIHQCKKYLFLCAHLALSPIPSFAASLVGNNSLD
jgi:hypothetical protein